MKIFKSLLPFVTIVLFLMTNTITNAQNTIYSKDDMGTYFDLKEKKYEKKLIGNNYVSENWQIADITLVGDTIEFKGVNVKLDIANRVIELKYGEEVKLLPSTHAKTIKVTSVSPIIYVTRVGIGLYGPSGFYKMLYEGDQKLLCHYSTRVEPSHYNEALGSGQKDDKIVKVETYYISKGEKLVPLELKKSKLANQLGGGDALVKYMKAEGLSPKKEMDLVKIIQHVDRQNTSN